MGSRAQRAQCAPCCCHLPPCLWGQRRSIPDTVEEALHLPGGSRDPRRATHHVTIGTRPAARSSDQGRLSFLKAVPAPHPSFGRLGSHGPRGGPDQCWGVEKGVSGAESCQGGWGGIQGEEHQEAQTPDGNQMYFLGPERISETMEVEWGKSDYKKGFLISLQEKKSLGLTFVSPKDVYVTS